jgi:DEAD/DEAH box helicase domain-containing protein
VGYGDIFLPEEEMHTRSVVLLFKPGTRGGEIFAALDPDIKEYVIAALGTLFINVAPVFLMCDSRDLHVAERLKDPHFSDPAIYIYDSYPGGIGLSEGFSRNIDAIVEAARDLVFTCPCQMGCPSCIGPEGNFLSRDVGENIDLKGINPKEGVKQFLHQWLSSTE